MKYVEKLFLANAAFTQTTAVASLCVEKLCGLCGALDEITAPRSRAESPLSHPCNVTHVYRCIVNKKEAKGN